MTTDTASAVRQQREFFLSGKTLSIDFRLSMLKALRKAVVEMEDEISAALRSDLGKSRTEAYMTEIGMTLSVSRQIGSGISFSTVESASRYCTNSLRPSFE